MKRVKDRLSIEEKRIEIAATAGPMRLAAGSNTIVRLVNADQPYELVRNGRHVDILYARVELSLLAPGIGANLAFSTQQKQSVDATFNAVLTGMPNPNFYDFILLSQETLYASCPLPNALKITSVYI